MDEMRIVTPFLKGIIAKILTKLISDKLSLDTSLKINDLQVTHNGETGQIEFQVNLGGSLSGKQLKEFLDTNNII